MASATYHAAPPYPTVVAAKLSTITAPNGVAGFCGMSGLSASARNPDGLPMEPALIATTNRTGRSGKPVYLGTCFPELLGRPGRALTKAFTWGTL